jgi:ABC-2 type transport system permease protein
MLPVLFFEITYRLRRPATWIYALIFFVLGIVVMTTDAVRIGGGYGKVFSNAPYNLHQIISVMGYLGVFIIMAFFSVPVFRDREHKMDTFLYAFPIEKKDYLAGRFLGTLIICTLVYSLLPLGMVLGEAISRIMGENPENWGAFSLLSYLWPFVIALMPGILLLGSLFFSLVTLSGRMMYAYLAAASFIVLYSISLNLLSELDNKFLAALLDPFGLIAAGNVTEYWSISEKNSLLVPLQGVYLWNRLLWSVLGLGFLMITFLRFRMSPVSDSKGKMVQLPEEGVSAAMATSPPQSNNVYSAFSTFLSLTTLELKQTMRNGIFLAMLFVTALFMCMDAWFADQTYETGIHPVTGIMIESVSSFMFSILSIAILIFLAGEIVWREREVKMEGIYDAFPVQNSSIFFSKLTALFMVPVLLLMLVPLCGISVQLLKGFTDIEIGLYLKTLLLFELPRLWLVAMLAFAIQVILPNKYAGNVAILVYYISFIGLNYLKFEHPLFRYGAGLNYTYSDMNAFGDFVKPFRIYLLHWFFTGVFILSIAYLFLARGAESSFRARRRLAFQQIRNSSGVKTGLGLSFCAMMGTGFFITSISLNTDHFMNSKTLEEASVAYEKKFSFLNRSLHPSLKDVKIEADMFPENGDLRLASDFLYVNPYPRSIDTLWYNLNPEGKVSRFELSRPARLVYEDRQKGIRAYKLNKPLASGDSFRLKFEMLMAFTGLDNESPVKGNGTFFNNSYWPYVGYNEAYQLGDEDKRKEYGLTEIPPMDRQDDTLATQHSLFDYHNHSIRFEAVLSTSPDQIAIAPGYLQKEWINNGRRYFHYRMDRPISNFYSIISARYSVHRENFQGTEISVYHHPAHSWNVKKMAEAVRHSLSYYQKNYAPYQHRQVRILEFPRYASFAQSFDNTIPYSEGIGFISNLEEKDAIDYVYFVTAHEMSHQWWGHQIIPANTRGAQFLSETMSEYSALMVMRERYGEELMGRFLRKELDSYLGGRSRETKKENTLMDIETQAYAYYRKGSLVMYRVMSLMGEQNMNQFLGEFVRKFRFQERPYPTTRDFESMLIQRLSPENRELAADQLQRITLYKNRMVSAVGKKLPDNSFEIVMKVELGKMYVDSAGGNERKAAFNGKIGLALLAEKNPKKKADVLKMENLELKDGQEIRWICRSKPQYAALDPFYTFTDILPEDNLLSIDWQ